MTSNGASNGAICPLPTQKDGRLKVIRAASLPTAKFVACSILNPHRSLQIPEEGRRISRLHRTHGGIDPSKIWPICRRRSGHRRWRRSWTANVNTRNPNRHTVGRCYLRACVRPGALRDRSQLEQSGSSLPRETVMDTGGIPLSAGVGSQGKTSRTGAPRQSQ